MKCAVVGLGEFGRAMAISLARYGVEVMAIDREKKRVEAVKDEVTLAVCVDSMDEAALRDLGIGEMDLVVAGIGENFEAQVLLVVYAKRLGAKKIIARATSDAHRMVLRAVGADEVYNPEEEAAHRITQRIVFGGLEKFMDLADGFSVIEIQSGGRLVGQTLRKLALRNRYRINVVAIRRYRTGDHGREQERFELIPSPDEPIGEKDKLILVGSVLDLGRFIEDYDLSRRQV